MREKLLYGGLAVGIALGVMALWPEMAGAGPLRQFDDPVEQGEYLTTVAMCVFCHTPFKEQFAEIENAGPEELRMAAFDISEILDESRLFAGGHEIPLGPAGVIVTRNLTPDVETGLGDWTDEEIKTAIRNGVSRDDHQLNPVMPYLLFNNMAESDLDAIVAYLRTLTPIENKIEHEPDQHMMMEEMPALPVREGIVAPDPSDTAARGEYLIGAVVLCTFCHTPLDEATGEPIMDLALAGGQPFEGPWGVVYAGNLTPHDETGIGLWSDEEVKRVISEGIRNDRRRTVLMPWEYTSKLTPEDVDAIVHFLRSIPPVDREVPAPALLEGLFEYVEIPTEEAPSLNTALLIGTVAAALAVGAFLVIRRRGSSGRS
jgi:cytochrome c553